MSWISGHKSAWRVVILVLLLVAIWGPWTFDLIVVPSEYSCSPPFIRLEGDYCGEPMSGTRFFSWMVAGFFNMVVGLVTGATVLPDMAREFLERFLFLMLLFLLILPFFTTMLLIRSGDHRRQQVFNIAVWGLAAGVLLLIGVSNLPRLYWVLWGIWLYIILAASALILEVLTMATGRKLSQG